MAPSLPAVEEPITRPNIEALSKLTRGSSLLARCCFRVCGWIDPDAVFEAVSGEGDP